ncbi:MAG: pantoate--beta-alanine ligase [Candidatus Nitronauta litoralis]|uniref:Pantothenate synthetase n=1 Tax=Candidatus Nitronauta litoralis TaxID=2705533 RepID=A0A7T0G1F6_9BACT|nr:MAG: pantoate--beta-alanine ligase [Candidatus Nitronauta litoralis]
MKQISNISEMKSWSRAVRGNGQTVGFVPTMGYLHDGHLALVKHSLKECDRTVVSIFVNPIQFAPGEDLDSYPANLERDINLLSKLGVDAVFVPTRDELVPKDLDTFVEVKNLTEHLCGKSRPEFFRGVTTIVLKLFHIVQPDIAIFGEKDRQQLEVIRKMVADLNLDIKVLGLPITREQDGIAQSSRNTYLNPEERISARSLCQALESGRTMILNGETSAKIVKNQIRSVIESQTGTRIDYVSVCDPKRFDEISQIGNSVMLALAVHIGKARLIDNCLVEKSSCKEPC